MSCMLCYSERKDTRKKYHRLTAGAHPLQFGSKKAIVLPPFSTEKTTFAKRISLPKTRQKEGFERALTAHPLETEPDPTDDCLDLLKVEKRGSILRVADARFQPTFDQKTTVSTRGDISERYEGRGVIGDIHQRVFEATRRTLLAPKLIFKVGTRRGTSRRSLVE